MRTVALLLDDEHNSYQQLLVREGRTAAAKYGFRLLPAEWAGGSSWTQVDLLNKHLHAESRPDGLLAILAGSQSMKSVFERVVKAGLATVLLNRLPDWYEDVRTQHEGFVGGVAPDQVGIGRVQGEQALRLVPDGAVALLVTGVSTSAAAIDRRRGFLDLVRHRLAVHEVDGGWSAPGAERAVDSWFRVGAGRERPPQVVVCHNDAMAAGARTALLRQLGTPDSRAPKIPIVGCDGLAEEGRAAITRGDLTATVVLPPTTPAALQMLADHWRSGARANVVRLTASSYPSLLSLRSA